VSATYRIDVKRDDDETMYPWHAVITRLADNWPVRVEREHTADKALGAAREWIASTHDFAFSIHVDDQGRDAEAPQSVKVPE
jgi:hypothetical protein